MADKPPYWLDIDDLLKIFSNYNKESLYKAIQRDVFPIKTFRLGKRIYADKEAVRRYFKRLRDEALRDLEETS